MLNERYALGVRDETNLGGFVYSMRDIRYEQLFPHVIPRDRGRLGARRGEGLIAGLLAPSAYNSAPVLHIVAAVLTAASSARTWPWRSCSPSPSCASCGLAWTATASPLGERRRSPRAWGYWPFQGPRIVALFWRSWPSKRGASRSASAKPMALR